MSRIPPEACETMAEVRAGVDSIDRALVTLLAERMRFMDAAARIKPGRNMVRDEPRKAQVIANAQREAEALGLDPALVGQLWEQLVEASIAHETIMWDRLRAQGDDNARD
ncbi:chorismate mutase [Sandaracinobacteroides sp. A072]|uniref:chorismate mutase n=1 Tax=Sandaracinobacteroides sp. A072 TaxID=3461146 RepID=UPI0040421C74